MYAFTSSNVFMSFSHLVSAGKSASRSLLRAFSWRIVVYACASAMVGISSAMKRF